MGVGSAVGVFVEVWAWFFKYIFIYIYLNIPPPPLSPGLLKNLPITETMLTKCHSRSLSLSLSPF